MIYTASPPPGRLLAGYHAEREGYHVRRTHGTRDWLITFTVSGHGVYQLRNETFVCRQGDVVLLSPGTPHDYAAPKGRTGWMFFWAHFTPRPAWMDWLTWTQGNGLTVLRVADASSRKRLRAAFARMVRDNRTAAGGFNDELAHNALAEVLIIVAHLHAQATANRLDPRVMQVMRRLSDDLDAVVPVSELARAVALSPSRLSHLFKAQVGESIVAARMKLRMRHAARLLEFTPRSVTEIGSDVGFQSLYQFSRQFSRWYGISPARYRKQAREGRSELSTPPTD